MVSKSSAIRPGMCSSPRAVRGTSPRTMPASLRRPRPPSPASRASVPGTPMRTPAVARRRRHDLPLALLPFAALEVDVMRWLSFVKDGRPSFGVVVGEGVVDVGARAPDVADLKAAIALGRLSALGADAASGA